MDALKKSVESQGSAVMERAEAGQIRVFQPQSLKEIVDIIDLMGNVATRVREDKSRDLGSGGAGSAAAKKIAEENRVYFKTVEEAKAAGFSA